MQSYLLTCALVVFIRVHLRLYINASKVNRLYFKVFKAIKHNIEET